MKGTLHEGRYTVFIISGSVLLRMKNVSNEVGKKNIHFAFNKFFFRNRAVCEIMWKIIIVERSRPQMAI